MRDNFCKSKGKFFQIFFPNLLWKLKVEFLNKILDFEPLQHRGWDCVACGGGVAMDGPKIEASVSGTSTFASSTFVWSSIEHGWIRGAKLRSLWCIPAK